MLTIPTKRIARFVRTGWVVFDNRGPDLGLYCENPKNERLVYSYLADRWVRVPSDDRLGREFLNREYVLAIRPLIGAQVPQVVECWELSNQRLYGPLAGVVYALGMDTDAQRGIGIGKINGSVRNSGFEARKARQEKERKKRDHDRTRRRSG